MGKHNKLVEKIKNRGEATISCRNKGDQATDLEKHLALKKDSAEDRRVIIYFFFFFVLIKL